MKSFVITCGTLHLRHATSVKKNVVYNESVLFLLFSAFSMTRTSEQYIEFSKGLIRFIVRASQAKPTRTSEEKNKQTKK